MHRRVAARMDRCTDDPGFWIAPVAAWDRLTVGDQLQVQAVAGEEGGDIPDGDVAQEEDGVEGHVQERLAAASALDEGRESPRLQADPTKIATQPMRDLGATPKYPACRGRLP
jgi:hypothetical protein